MSSAARQNVIALYGPPLAGKLTVAKALADAYQSRAETFEVAVPEFNAADVGVSFQVMVKGHVIKVVTLSGGVLGGEKTWKTCLSGAAGLAFVVDGRRFQEDTNLRFAAFSAGWGSGAVARCLILTHQDQITLDADRVDTDALLQAAGMRTAPVFRLGKIPPAVEHHPLVWLATQVIDP